jgi:hypothetical protein
MIFCSLVWAPAPDRAQLFGFCFGPGGLPAGLHDLPRGVVDLVYLGGSLLPHPYQLSFFL